MAKKEVEVEVAASEAKSSGPSMKTLIIVLVLVQLVMFGGLAAFLMSSGIVGKHSASASSAETKTEKEASEAIYIPFEPAFTVNFGGAQSSRFMQVTIEAMTHDPSVVAAVKKHMPVIRNAIVLLLSSQSVDAVSTLDGKEKLRQEILASVQKILKDRTGKPGIDEIYFTSFVMQ